MHLLHRFKQRSYTAYGSPRPVRNCALGGDDEMWVLVLAAWYTRGLPFRSLPQKARGRRRPSREGAGKTGCAPHPRSRVHGATREWAHERTGSAETLRPSLRNGLTAYAALSLVTGFLTPSPAALTANLTPALGASGPHGFAVRIDAARR